MKLSDVIAFADPFVDEKGLEKALVGKFVTPFLDGVIAKVKSGEIDLIKGTDMDAIAVTMLLEKIKALVDVQ